MIMIVAKKLANFTLHDQKENIFKWKQFSFIIDPEPRAPVIDYEPNTGQKKLSLIWF